MSRIVEVISAERIAERVRELATEIARRWPPAPEATFLMVVCLKGAFVFAADLVRALDAEGVRPEVDFLVASSYGDGTESRGVVTLRVDASADPRGRDVLLVDDILDTGRSLAHVAAHLLARGAASVGTCVLLDKPGRRAVPFAADFVGFEVGTGFLVGYGIDWAERYRHLPYVGVVEEG